MLIEPTDMSDGVQWLPWSQVRVVPMLNVSWLQVAIRNAFHVCLCHRFQVVFCNSHLSVQERRDLLVVVSKVARSLLWTRCHFCSASLPMGFSCNLFINYADNFGVVSDTEAGATEAYNMIARAMVCVGLQAHDESRATCDAESLGVRLRLNNGVVTMSTQRRRRLGSRCREYARRKRTCRRRLEKILAHQTLTSLLVAQSSLVPCLDATLRLPRSERCYGSDASLTGDAFTLRSASVHVVSSTSRLRTNVVSSAKKQPSAIRLRQHALFIRKTDHQETFDDNDDDVRFEVVCHPRAILSGFEIVIDFVEVPFDFFLFEHSSLVSSLKMVP